MNFIEKGINKKDLGTINESQSIETPEKLTAETSEQVEEKNDLDNQVKMSRERWGNFISSIIEKNYQSDKLENNLIWLTEKFQKTKNMNHGLDAGGWTQMTIDMASDKNLGHIVDDYQEMKILEFISGESLDEERETLITNTLRKNNETEDNLIEQNGIKKRTLFLEKLLNQTTKHFSLSNEKRDENQEKILVSLWSDIFARFLEMRIQASQERLKEFLPEINKTKQETIDFLKENYPNIISPEGLARIKNIQIWINDEYLESGTDWNISGSYNGDKTPPSLEISGLKSLDKEKFNKILKHELIHTASGHGAPSQPKAEQGTTNQHIRIKRRVGLADEKSNNWLNEAITEKLCGKINNIPEDKLSYPLERTIYSLLLERQNIKEEDLMRLYFTEGDDSAEKEKLQKLHPEFFEKLALIQKMSKGGKTLERLTKEDMESFIKTIF